MNKSLFFIYTLLISHIFCESLVIEKKFLPPKSADIYRYVSFEVPDNIRETQVSYEYDRQKHTVDVGIFDSNGLGKEGFRGWSGGSKSEFIIAENHATASYLPGPLYKGKWHVIFGLYKVTPTRVDITIKIDFKLMPTNPSPNPRSQWNPNRVLEDNARWYKGDLHMHTNHSDGKQTIEELVT
ncbi:hypothetical protein [Candidatus Uabimicrobium sp. HlEnr_7]|uniref:hypothetical protein n=1 Tax=Candidatus Uabimicrobium helgolandensis TaxID=3095367 RepID=UPI003556E3F5